MNSRQPTVSAFESNMRSPGRKARPVRLFGSLACTLTLVAASIQTVFAPGAEARAGELMRSQPAAHQSGPSLGAADPNCANTSVGFTPLSDLGTGTYMGVEGGLYAGGKNVRPAAHDSAGLALAEDIGPLTAGGQSDPSGRYVLLSIGMSNTRDEFRGFEDLAAADPNVDDRLVIVNGAQGGVPASDWANPQDDAWNTVDQKLSGQGLTPKQVAVAWVKLANRTYFSNPPGPWPAYADEFKADLRSVVQILADRYPNLRLAYLSSRIYGGYQSVGGGNPEPFAYEGGFSVKWLIQDQIDGASDLNFDASKGKVEAPWLAWGPYLWADGLVPRSDGLIWECSDFVEDGVHPSDTGVEKVASMLLEFLNTDSTAAQWFTPTGAPPPSGDLSTTLDASRAKAGYLQRFTLSGEVTAGQDCPGPYDVTIQKRVHGSKAVKTIARSVQVGGDGSWSATHRSKKNAAYSAVVSGGTCVSESSAPEDVLVKARVLVDVPGACRAPQGIRGRVLPNHSGTDVVLKHRRGGAWRSVDRDDLNGRSRYRLVAAACSGRYKVVWPTQGKKNIRGTRHFRL